MWQAIGVGDQVYIVGGHNNLDDTVVNTTFMYDPILQTYTQMADMPEGRAEAMGALLNGSIYIAGGLVDNDPDGEQISIFEPSSYPYIQTDLVQLK